MLKIATALIHAVGKESVVIASATTEAWVNCLPVIFPHPTKKHITVQ
jgi:hypothetical protein